MGWQDAPLVGGDATAAPPQSGGGWQSAPVVGDAPKAQDGADAADWHRDTVLPLEHNRRTGEWRWAMPGMVQGAVDAATLPGDVLSGKTPLDPRVSYRDQDPATLDRAATLGSMMAGELPLAARNMVPATARNIVDAAGKPLPKLVARELAAANLDAGGVRAGLDSLGGAGVLGDLTPRLQARTGAIATTPGPGQDLVVEALRNRAAGANRRIQTSVAEAIGQPPVPSRVAQEIRDSQTALSPEYTDTLAGAASGDLGRIAENIDNGIMQEKGPARSALQRVREFLNFSAPAAEGLPATAPILDPNPTGWLKARQAIDGMLEGETDSNVVRVLSQARREIDSALATHVPGIKNVDDKFAELARQQEGLDLGQRAIRPGDAPLHPAEFADAMAAGAVPQGQFIGPSGVPIRIRQGLVADIDRIIGTKANDRVALRDILKGDGSWNREKLVTAFGQDRADRLIRLFENEARMAQTENLAFGNSKTEVLRSAKEGIEPRSGPGVVRNAANLKFGDAAASVADALLGGAIKRGQMKKNEAIARALLANRGLRVASPGGVAAALASGVARHDIMEVGKNGGVLGGYGGGGGGY